MRFPHVLNLSPGRSYICSNFNNRLSCAFDIHGSYKLEKVLNFSSRLEKSLNSVKVLEKYLISLLGLEKSLKFSNLLIPYHFSEKLNDSAEKIGALTTNNWR